MSHERSETIQRPDGQWVNVYGRGLPQFGQQLPGTPTYATVDEAVKAAGMRSFYEDPTRKPPMPPAPPPQDPKLRLLIDILRK